MHPRKLSRIELRTLELCAEKLIACIHSFTEITPKKNSEKQVPQANDLSLVIRTAVAIARRKTEELPSFVTRRQKNYYYAAAEILGLVHEIKGDYYSTELGKKLAQASGDDVERILANIMLSLPIFRKFAENANNANKRIWSLEEIGDFISKQTGLSKATARRRAQTIASWLIYIRQARKKGSATIELFAPMAFEK
ncbi:MAG: AAA-associated domain-containing protein, partial [Candidatus Bathyarchaeota archaeon]|nr:AAA-associated domain-containing protein [Candidatus Bathyarchaeota archaeon]